MRCRSCGADLKGDIICSRCGKRIEDLSQKLEVEYKDFKVSELLEIRSKDHGAPEGKAHIEKTGETLRREETGGAGESTRSRQGLHKERKSSFLIALILFLLALIASAVFLWNLFTR
jgi:hypothetical protein